MELNKYQQLALRTVPKDKDFKERRKEFSLGLCEESGEVAGVLKKHLYHNHPMTQDKITKLIGELGDVMWHAAVLAHEFGMTLEEVCCFNISKLSDRYPDGYSDERSINRHD